VAEVLDTVPQPQRKFVMQTAHAAAQCDENPGLRKRIGCHGGGTNVNGV
jgi:hypothetical protein